MTNIDRKDHTTRWISVKDLSVVWAQAQRGFDEKRAAKIGDELDPDYFGIITVTQADKSGQHHVIDGQHRVGGVRMVWGDDQKVPCNVLDVNDPKKAADIFVHMNSSRFRRNPLPIDIFRAAVTAGYREENEVNDLLKRLGYMVVTDGREGGIRAVASCMTVYRQHGLPVLEKSLRALQAIWGMEPSSVDGQMILGMADFMASHPVLDQKRLVDRTAKHFMPGRLLGAAQSARDAMRCTVARAINHVLTNTYNEHLIKHRLDMPTDRKIRANGPAK